MSQDESKGDVGDDLVDLLHRLAGVLREHRGNRPRLLIAAIDNEAGHHRRSQE